MVVLDHASATFTASGGEERVDGMPDATAHVARQAAAACGIDHAGVDIVIDDPGWSGNVSERRGHRRQARTRPAHPCRVGAESRTSPTGWFRSHFPTREHATVPRKLAVTGPTARRRPAG
ncbi:MAG: hypothetical protein IPI27_14530 [Betaproteobacteria bacterium]|nr:hypothetical protein [Betaproteobacteria bacterium]